VSRSEVALAVLGGMLMIAWHHAWNVAGVLDRIGGALAFLGYLWSVVRRIERRQSDRSSMARPHAGPPLGAFANDAGYTFGHTAGASTCTLTRVVDGEVRTATVDPSELLERAFVAAASPPAR
jgi:hypothetical protein